MPDEYAVYKDGRRIGTARKADPMGDTVGGAAGCLIWLAGLVAVFLVVPLAISLLAPFVTTIPRTLRKKAHWSPVLIALLNISLLIPPVVIAWMALWPPVIIDSLDDTRYYQGWDAFVYQQGGMWGAAFLIALGVACLILIVWGAVRHKWLKQTGKGIVLLATAYGRGVADVWRWLFDKIFGGGQNTSTEQSDQGTGEVNIQLIRDLMRAHTASAGNKLAQDALLEKVAAELRRAGVSPDETSGVMHEILDSDR